MLVARKRRKIASELLKNVMSVNVQLKVIINTLKRAHDIFREFSRADLATFEQILSPIGSTMSKCKGFILIFYMFKIHFRTI